MYTGVDAPLRSELWVKPPSFTVKAAITAAKATSYIATYVNRKMHSGGTYHIWVTTGEPDPDMSETTPPFAKSEYTDHVVVAKK